MRSSGQMYSCLSALAWWQHYVQCAQILLSPAALLTLLHALVIRKLDYCNSELAGASEVLLCRLQSVPY